MGQTRGNGSKGGQSDMSTMDIRGKRSGRARRLIAAGSAVGMSAALVGAFAPVSPATIAPRVFGGPGCPALAVLTLANGIS